MHRFGRGEGKSILKKRSEEVSRKEEKGTSRWKK